MWHMIFVLFCFTRLTQPSAGDWTGNTAAIILFSFCSLALISVMRWSSKLTHDRLQQIHKAWGSVSTLPIIVIPPGASFLPFLECMMYQATLKSSHTQTLKRKILCVLKTKSASLGILIILSLSYNDHISFTQFLRENDIKNLRWEWEKNLEFWMDLREGKIVYFNYSTQIQESSNFPNHPYRPKRKNYRFFLG